MAGAICEAAPTSFHVEQTEAHCVFRRANSWFALPAAAVREVLFRPEIVAVPFSSEMITGLCHLRSEFLAVVNLDGLLADDAAGYLSERKMIVVNGPEGPWALLVDEVDVLAVLETNAVSDPGRRGDIVNAVVARAVHGSHVVQVLDPDRLYDAAGRDRSVEE